MDDPNKKLKALTPVIFQAFENRSGKVKPGVTNVLLNFCSPSGIVYFIVALALAACMLAIYKSTSSSGPGSSISPMFFLPSFLLVCAALTGSATATGKVFRWLLLFIVGVGGIALLGLSPMFLMVGGMAYFFGGHSAAFPIFAILVIALLSAFILLIAEINQKDEPRQPPPPASSYEQIAAVEQPVTAPVEHIPAVQATAIYDTGDSAGENVPRRRWNPLQLIFAIAPSLEQNEAFLRAVGEIRIRMSTVFFLLAVFFFVFSRVTGSVWAWEIAPAMYLSGILFGLLNVRTYRENRIPVIQHSIEAALCAAFLMISRF